MPRSTSFRLDDQLMERLETESKAASTSVTSLVSSIVRSFSDGVALLGDCALGGWCFLLGGVAVSG